MLWRPFQVLLDFSRVTSGCLPLPRNVCTHELASGLWQGRRRRRNHFLAFGTECVKKRKANLGNCKVREGLGTLYMQIPPEYDFPGGGACSAGDQSR